ncbi:hypothetical protein SBY92_002357 [Candida maltosa Xu316]
MITRRPFRIRWYSTRIPQLSQRVLKRNQRRLTEFENNIKLADQFKTHRNNILELMKDESHIDALFDHDFPMTVTEHSELQNHLGATTYTDIDMRNTITLVCHSLAESIRVELALREVADPRLDSILENIKGSIHFDAVEDYRFRFYNIKSSQFLNYTESDIMKEVDGSNFVRFTSPVKDSQEYISRFTQTFDKYETTHQHEPLAHIDIGVNLIRDMLSCSTYIPTVEIWHYLLAKLDTYELYHYQSLVYSSLFQYKHQPTVLGAPQPESQPQTKPRLMADHFTHLVEAYPEILSSLCQYQTSRNDKDTFVELLSFFKLDKLAGEVLALKKSPLLSKAKYNLPQVCPGIDLDTKNLRVSRQCIYSVMRSAIALEMYEYVDLLYDKIVLDSVDPDTVQLDYTPDKLVEGTIFTTELFAIMLDACKESNDLGRLLWLLPFLDEHIAKNKDTIPESLKTAIMETLTVFNLEGKLLAYGKIL